MVRVLGPQSTRGAVSAFRMARLLHNHLTWVVKSVIPTQRAVDPETFNGKRIAEHAQKHRALRGFNRVPVPVYQIMRASPAAVFLTRAGALRQKSRCRELVKEAVQN